MNDQPRRAVSINELLQRCVVPTNALHTQYGEEPRFAEGLYALTDDTYAWMVPNGSWGEANAGLIVGDGESLLIDTLWDVPKTQGMLDAMAPYHKACPINTVVNTHADGDHFWGNQLIADADVITTDASLAEMAHHQPKTLFAFQKMGRLLACLPTAKSRKAGHWFQAMCAPYDFAGVAHTPAKRGFSGTLNLSVGGREVRLIEVGPAHTNGDLMVHVPDARTLFASDILFIGSTPVMWAGPLENWFRALDRILALDIDIIVPGHGPFATHDDVIAVKDYWTFVLENARQHFDSGTRADVAAFKIASGRAFRDRGYDAWDSPERLMTNVHMLYRGFRGRSHRPSTLAIIRMMYRQALLAHDLPEASPTVMRSSATTSI